MINDTTGIYIWYKAIDTSSKEATLKIYRTGQGGYSRDSILHLTPPSRPMGIVVDYHIEGENYMRPIITWDHNQEPDMLRTDLKKRYKIWRATSDNMSSVPENYTLLITLDIDSGTAPSYIDTSVIALGSGWPGMGEQIQYLVRYTVQAIDKYADSSVRSDFGSVIGLRNCSICKDAEPTEDNFQIHKNIPEEYSLSQNYPNPFNPVTKIKYDIPFDGNVSIKIFDISGRLIVLVRRKMEFPFFDLGRSYCFSDFNSVVSCLL